MFFVERVADFTGSPEPTTYSGKVGKKEEQITRKVGGRITEGKGTTQIYTHTQKKKDSVCLFRGVW